MRYMKMTFVVSETKLPLVLQVLKGEFSNLEVMEVQPKAGTVPRASRSAKRESMPRTTLCAFKWLAQRKVGDVVKKNQLSDALEAIDLNRNSASPTISRLVKDGILKRIGSGTYEVAKVQAP